ncbi:MAG: NUDIX hydrolase [Chlamydiae bacterium]|nr:NUDIX hydrolase [Chlamydiota bacterium]
MLPITPPQYFSPKAEVAAVIPFINEDKALILQRLPSHPQANMWVIPGGKILPGETPSHAAVRELREETGIEIDLKSLIYLGKFYVRYPNGDFTFYLFKTYISSKQVEVKISEREHQAYCICPVQEVYTFALTPGLDECFELALKSDVPLLE